MRVTLWGTRGSLPTPGSATARYGGNTSCVEVRASDGSVLILDAGTGIRQLGDELVGNVGRVDLLLTHLHMDHIQGLGFFRLLHDPGVEVHLWGPASATLSLGDRLSRYLSPPLFPIHLRELPCSLHLHEVPGEECEIGNLRVAAQHVCHPNPTVGYRIVEEDTVVTYLPDHEPALGLQHEYLDATWTSGYGLAHAADLLIHDAQYAEEEYNRRVGWGHSSLHQALTFAQLADVKHFVPFHHDPGHADNYLDKMLHDSLLSFGPTFLVTPGMEGTVFELGNVSSAVKVER